MARAGKKRKTMKVYKSPNKRDRRGDSPLPYYTRMEAVGGCCALRETFASVVAACVPCSMPDAVCDACDGGGVERPQGGGGYDHPTKVQQNRAQTDNHLSLSAILSFHSFLLVLFSVIISLTCPLPLSFVPTFLVPCPLFYGFAAILETPGVLGTLFMDVAL